MILLKRGDFYSLYNNKGYCLGCGKLAIIQNVISLWGKKSNGDKDLLIKLMEDFKLKHNHYAKHTEYIKTQPSEDLLLHELIEQSLKTGRK